MAVTLIAVFLLLIAVLAPLVGADSRDGRDWQPRDVNRNDDLGQPRMRLRV